TRQVLIWFSENCRGRAMLSLMTQYTPINMHGSITDIPRSYVSENDYEKVLSMLDEFGIDDGYCQEPITGSEWLPDFTRQNPFSSGLSLPVWHWKKQFDVRG
ncbi:MAG: radical SAM protein, partial [Treponema sp.]|nr:radical SAM protein [Treponema sp.]